MTLSALPRVLGEVEPVARRFAAAGHRLYLVGGIVRDLWLDRDVGDGDVDLTTDAPPGTTLELVSPIAEHLWTQGERFGTIGCTIGGRSYEITTHRAEAYDPASRKPEVVFGTDVVVDLSRRDFTVNAMAWEVPDGELVDPFGGVDDLDARVLRTPLEPAESFADDPLRMVRAARFAASLGLTPTAEVRAAMTELAPRLEIVAVERIREELEDKLLVLADAGTGVELLAQTGLLERVVPELAEPGSAARAVARVASVAPSRRLRLAALLAELDGPALRRRLAALRCSNADRRDIARLVSGAVTVAAGPPADDAALRRLGAEVGVAAIDDVFDLARALGDEAVVGEWRERWARLAATEDLSDLDGPLDGRAVSQLLGIDPGPAVGAALAEQRRLRIEQGPLGPAEVTAALSRWWEARRGSV